MRHALVSIMALMCACSMLRIDNGLLTSLPEEQMEEVRAARAAHALAVDESATRTRERKSANDRVDIAEAEFEVASAELATSRIRARLAEKDGSMPERKTAGATVAHREASLHAARMGIALRRCEFDLATRREELAKVTTSLREVEVELVKAEAVKDLDTAKTRSMSVTQFELQVKQREKVVATAEMREAEATERMFVARHEFEAAQREADRLGSDVTTTGALPE